MVLVMEDLHHILKAHPTPKCRIFKIAFRFAENFDRPFVTVQQAILITNSKQAVLSAGSTLKVDMSNAVCTPVVALAPAGSDQKLSTEYPIFRVPGASRFIANQPLANTTCEPIYFATWFSIKLYSFKMKMPLF
ncbi:hypothetical protein TNCT_160681 [Trichonephila clavata]|uniref:Uncharacterized protein n=1 Tax=Trichonephila clavata TaxID=2740835 RepID=A0A8X6L4A7_TRICU|nr:hypothetical protein TNCT_160681 [Trichonephila clavata]